MKIKKQSIMKEKKPMKKQRKGKGKQKKTNKAEQIERAYSEH